MALIRLLEWFLVLACYNTAGAILSKRSGGSHFDYQKDGAYGPEQWSKNAPNCAGSAQSPIDISSANVVHDAQKAFAWKFVGYNKPLTNYVVKNTGHSLQVDIPSESIGKYLIKGGGQTYELLQFHFHWGQNAQTGSEHTVEGKHYPLEMHLVHKKQGLSGSQAGSQKRGLAVIGVFFEISKGNRENRQLQKIIQEHINVQDPSDQVEILNSRSRDGIRLDKLVPPAGKSSALWRYDGSLTTPPCSEAVWWTLYQTPGKVSERQVEHLSTGLHAKDEHGHEELMSHNYRPTQPLNGRKIYAP